MNYQRKTKKGYSRLIIYVILVIALFVILRNQSEIKRKFFPNTEVSSNLVDKLSEESYGLQLKGYGTTDIMLSDTKGKVTYLQFWGTWCPDCMLEMPSVQQFYDKYKDSIQFVLVDIEKDNNYKKLESFVAKKKYNLPFYEPISPISKQLNPTSFPTTYIINKQGIIISKVEGATDWTDPMIQQPIVDLLKE